MKKRKNLGKKLVTMLVSVGLFAVLITVLNLMALQAIRGKNNIFSRIGLIIIPPNFDFSVSKTKSCCILY